MPRKKARKPAAWRFKRIRRVGQPGNSQLVGLVIDQTPAPSATPADLAKTLDREWFRSHPYRSHRIRRAVMGEFPGTSVETYIAVRQLRPGVRQRIPFNALVQFPSEEPPEHIAHAMYELAVETRGKPILSHELFERSRAYEVAPDPEDASRDKPRYRH